MAAEESTFRQKVLTGLLWLATGNFLGQFISWCSTIIVIRMLSPSDYGLMSMATVFLNLLIMLSELGISSSIIQADEINEKEIRQIFGIVIISSFIGWTICFFSAPIVALFFKEDRLIFLIRIISINFYLIALFIIPQSILIREMNFKAKAKVDISAQIGASILALILALLGMGVWSLVYALIFLHLIKTIGFNIIHFYIFKPVFNPKGAGKLIKFGLTVTGDRLLYYLFTESDKIIIGRFLGDKLLGIYSVALNLASLPSEKILPLITQISFTSYSRIQDDVERINRNLLRSIRLISLVGFPLFWGMGCVAPEAIELILGQRWTTIVVPFQLLCIVMPFKALSPVFPPAVFAIGDAMVNLVNMAIASSFMAVAFVIGVQYGLKGICFAWIAVYPIVFCITTSRCSNSLKLPFRHVLYELIFPLFAALLMVVPILIFKSLNLKFSSLSILIISSLFGILFYVVVVFIFKKNTYLELKNLLNR